MKLTSDSFLFFAFTSLFLWLPLPLGSNRIWAISILEIWVMILALAWLGLFLQGKVKLTATFIKAKPVIICFGLFVLWAGFQSVVLSVSPYLSIVSTLLTLSYFLIFLLTLLLLNTFKRIKIFMMCIVISGLFQAVYGSLMALSTGVEYSFFLVKESSQGVASGTFVNRNHLAGYLEMSLAIGIGMMVASLSRASAHSFRDWFRRLIVTLLGQKAQLRIALAVMVVALVLTRSRMGNSAFFFSLAVAGIIGLVGLWWLSKKGKVSRHSLKPITILLVSLIAIDMFIVGAWFGIDKVKDRIEQTSFSAEIRDDVYINAVNYLQEYLLIGSGGGSYRDVFPQFKTQLFPGFVDHAHNDFLEFGSEYGLIGLMLLSVVVILSFYHAIKAQFLRRSYAMRGVGFSSAMAVISIMIHSTVDFNLQIPANAALFIVLLAFGWLAAYQRG